VFGLCDNRVYSPCLGDNVLRRDLIHLINSGNLWIFVGSGPSIEAGYPTWPELTNSCASQLATEYGDRLSRDAAYQAAMKARNYARALGQIEKISGAPKLHRYVQRAFGSPRLPAELDRILADWPAAGYITSNYDDLLFLALRQIGQSAGWVNVGNSDSELAKVGGDVSKVIWHVHGALAPISAGDRLVLTEQDYDAVYLRRSSIVTQLQSSLIHKRLLFIGFGFNDPDFLRILEAARLFTTPATPAFAFLGSEEPLPEYERMRLLERYIPD